MGILFEICKVLQEGRNMNEAMTPDEFEERLITIRETSKTDARRIDRMCELVVELLSDLGYEDGAVVFSDAMYDSMRW